MAQVGDELAPGPADLLELFGRGGGEHYVAAPGGDAASQLGPSGRPGIDGEHNLLGADGAAGRDHAGPGLKAQCSGALVDGDTTLEHGAAKPPGQARRLHLRPVLHERTAAEGR